MTAKQKHLDLKSRYVIEHSLDSSMSFKAIARELGKDCTTISKEIRNHLVFKKSGALGKPFNDCALRFDCDIFQVCQPCVNRSGRPCKFLRQMPFFLYFLQKGDLQQTLQAALCLQRLRKETELHSREKILPCSLCAERI